MTLRAVASLLLEQEVLPRRDAAPCVIELPSDERAAQESRARKYTSGYRDVIRAKIVLLAADGLGNDVIAARLDTPRQRQQRAPPIL